MRAREYDPQMGRFTSRDPVIGDPRFPEMLHAYNYANANPFVFTDPDGKDFSLASLSLSEFISGALDAMTDVAISQAKKKMQQMIFKAVSQVVTDQLANLFPPVKGFIQTLRDTGKAADVGRNFEATIKQRICGIIGADNKAVSMLLFLPEIDEQGDCHWGGENCPNLSVPQFLPKMHYPDFCISEGDPKTSTAILIGDIKLSGNSLYNSYVKYKKTGQFSAIVKYADRHTETHVAVFLTIWKGTPSKLAQVRALMGLQGLENGTLVLVISAL